MTSIVEYAEPASQSRWKSQRFETYPLCNYVYFPEGSIDAAKIVRKDPVTEGLTHFFLT